MTPRRRVDFNEAHDPAARKWEPVIADQLSFTLGQFLSLLQTAVLPRLTHRGGLTIPGLPAYLQISRTWPEPRPGAVEEAEESVYPIARSRERDTVTVATVPDIDVYQSAHTLESR